MRKRKQQEQNNKLWWKKKEQKFLSLEPVSREEGLFYWIYIVFSQFFPQMGTSNLMQKQRKNEERRKGENFGIVTEDEKKKGRESKKYQ